MAGFGGQLGLGSALTLLGGQGGGDMSYISPEVMQAYTTLVGYGYSNDEFMEGLAYQKERDEADRQYDYWNAEQAAQSAERQAQISAGAYSQAAAVGAEADMYAADQSLKAAQEAAAASRYAADQALAGLKISEENKIKIAAANLNLEAKRVAAEEMGAPSDWRTQAGYLRSQGMTHADITPAAIQQAGQALGPVAPELAPQATGAPPAAPAPVTAPTLPSPQQAVVGEQGPELATATPQGTQIEPIQPETAWWLRKTGTQGMQGGGTIPGYATYLPRVGFTEYTKPGGALGAGAIGSTPAVEPRKEPTSFTQPWTQQTPTDVRPYWERRASALADPNYGAHFLPQRPNTAGRIATKFATRGQAMMGQPGVRETLGGGVAPAAGNGGTDAAVDGTVPGEGTGEPPYLGMLRENAYVPLWEAWQGPRTNPDVGMDIPIQMPHEINYGNFVRLTPTEQQMAFADWQALGMAPDTALRIMQMSAMRGTASAGVGYG